MSGVDVEKIARTVLYEGYALFPYRASSLKNTRRVMFGALVPGASHEVQLLFRGDASTITARARWLHAASTSTWNAEERSSVIVPVVNGSVVTLRVVNETTTTMESVQLLVRGAGIFSSARVHEEADVDAANALLCRGLYPVFVGAKGSRDAVLCAPFVLEDWPAVASESPGDAFDATENDELLALSIQALSDDEKREMRAFDARTRALLERTEGLSDDEQGRLHGAWRKRPLRKGDAVVLRPKHRADVMDLALAGKRATVVSVDVDAEDRVHVSVTVDDDPGKDFGVQGHRFFFFVDELERVTP